MRKILLLFVTLLLLLSGYGQGSMKKNSDTIYDCGSNITFPLLTPQLIDNLDLLGRVWGFLKYHHPTISKGEYNWDYELFRMLPDYLQITDQQKRDDYLVKWIQRFGKIRTNKNVIPVDSTAFLKPDLTWINKEQLSPKLYKLLMKVYQNRNQSNFYYVTRNPLGAGNVHFINENAYSDISYPDAGFRLLSLYRYWNMVQYFFPYRYLTDTDWGIEMKKQIPFFIEASDQDEYFHAVRRMVAECDDSHAIVYSKSMISYYNYYRPPFNVRFLKNDTLVVDSYRNPEKIDKNGPRIGDVITHINNQPILHLIDSLSPYIAASNHWTKLREIAKTIVCSNDSFVELSYWSEGKQKTAVIPLYSFFELDYSNRTDGVCYQLLNHNIGYISMDDISEKHLKIIADTIKNTKGLILDMREYPKETLQNKLGKLLSDTSVPFAKFTYPVLNNPGEFVFVAPVNTQKGKEHYKGKVIILINEETQSHAEYCTMFYRTITNSIVIGTNSAGADGNVSRLELPGGIQTMFSGIGIYYPDGTETLRIGIVPDIYVWPTVQGVREGRDEVLEKALEILSE